MKFHPKTDKEIAEERLLTPGDYAFEISQGEDKVSSKGNDMIVLTLRVYKSGGEGFIILTDYLMEAMSFKLKHACDACGLTNQYESGELKGEDFFGKSGMLKLAIQSDKTGQYPDKNVVKDYIVPEADKFPIRKPNEPGKVTSHADLDDSIPF
jgi:hypothetical protein